MHFVYLFVLLSSFEKFGECRLTKASTSSRLGLLSSAVMERAGFQLVSSHAHIAYLIRPYNLVQRILHFTHSWSGIVIPFIYSSLFCPISSWSMLFFNTFFPSTFYATLVTFCVPNLVTKIIGSQLPQFQFAKLLILQIDTKFNFFFVMVRETPND